MRIAFTMILLAAAAPFDTAQADPYRWCAEYGGGGLGGGRNCYFLTIEQCRAAVSASAARAISIHSTMGARSLRRKTALACSAAGRQTNNGCRAPMSALGQKPCRGFNPG